MRLSFPPGSLHSEIVSFDTYLTNMAIVDLHSEKKKCRCLDVNSKWIRSCCFFMCLLCFCAIVKQKISFFCHWLTIICNFLTMLLRSSGGVCRTWLSCELQCPLFFWCRVAHGVVDFCVSAFLHECPLLPCLLSSSAELDNELQRHTQTLSITLSTPQLHHCWNTRQTRPECCCCF